MWWLGNQLISLDSSRKTSDEIQKITHWKRRDLQHWGDLKLRDCVTRDIPCRAKRAGSRCVTQLAATVWSPSTALLAPAWDAFLTGSRQVHPFVPELYVPFVVSSSKLFVFSLEHGLINFIDTKAKCRNLKKLTCKGTLFICLRPPSLLWPHIPPYTMYTCILYTYSHREGGRGRATVNQREGERGN
jgi:hypothetical protein